MDNLAAVESIFFAALEKTSPEERAAYLDEACGQDARLRASVERLLRAQPRVGGFLQTPAPGLPDTAAEQPPPEGPGTRVGPYKLLQKLGEGGMGTVYLAQQTEPVKRQVALKIIKPGMDSREVIARFEAERQALALMDHPNIAKVLDAGATPAGRPFFVMELVKGVPITKYCDEHRLTPRQRLELFVPVCQAVQHAHQKGIIHRDVKPSNVLVTLYDGRPVPKVIDFGVAKATEQRLTERTLFTQYGTLVGTLEYMSPEQAELNQLDIDTRSDIYSLGVLLYELLTGTTPLERKRLKEAGLLEVLRIIREVGPPTPSTRLGTTEGLPVIAANRGLEPKKLSGVVRGELDWIVMKALEKDRSRRYETANGFAADVLRYLVDEPVSAGPPSATYRLRKFVRRNRGPVMAAAVIFVLLLGGIVGTTLGLVRAERARQAEAERAEGERRAKLDAEGQKAKAVAAAEAERRAKDAEKAAKEQAQKRLGQIEKGNEILTGIFADLDIRKIKEGGKPLEAVLADRLLKAAEQLEGESVGEPVAVGALQNRLGESLLSLGFAPQAIPLFEKARATWQARLGPDHPHTLASGNNLAGAYREVGRTAEAIRLFEQTLKQTEARLGTDHRETATSRHNLALAYLDAGRTADAVRLHEQAVKQMEAKLGPEHPATLTARSNLANAYWSAGRAADAVRLHEQTLKQSEARFGPDHPETLTARHNLAEAYSSAGRTADAIRLAEQNLKLQKAKLGPRHPKVAATLAQLGLCLLQEKKYAEAEPLLRRCLKVREAKQPDDWATFNAQSMLGGALLGQKKYTDAEPLLLSGYQGMHQRQARIPPHGKVRLTEALERLTQLYDAWGRKDQADRWRKELQANKKGSGVKGQEPEKK
jgi:eukaryotic-like serine/threonine-protein kinase